MGSAPFRRGKGADTPHSSQISPVPVSRLEKPGGAVCGGPETDSSGALRMMRSGTGGGFLDTPSCQAFCDTSRLAMAFFIAASIRLTASSIFLELLALNAAQHHQPSTNFDKGVPSQREDP